MSTRANTHWDYIIVGAGSAGCVVANRLSADEAKRVLLLEAGGADTEEAIHIPAEVVQLTGTAVDWQYQTESQPHLNGRKIAANRGKVLGGSSSINSMIYIRGNHRDYDHWNYLGNEGWSWEEVLALFRRSEDYECGGSFYHGAGGPLQVTNNHSPTPAALAFIAGAMDLGFRGSVRGLTGRSAGFDFNGPEQVNGAGLYQYTITRDGRRCSSSVAFLDPIRGRPNLRIQTNAQARRIIIENGAAAGVEFVFDGGVGRAWADGEVIVCAGAFDSPKLLLLSGIGPASDLRRAGVAPMVDLPGVGSNLQDQLALPVLFQAKRNPPNPATVAEAGLFVHTRPNLKSSGPDLQFHFQAGLADFTDPQRRIDPSKIMFGAVFPRPLSRGKVSLRSANPRDNPVINPNLLQFDVEMKAAIAAIQLAREIAATRPMGQFVELELEPGLTNANLEEYVRNNSATMWHPACTCRMGYDGMAVVDPQLRVHGVRRLRVADASIMPDVVSGNTNATSIMIGEKASDLIAAA